MRIGLMSCPPNAPLSSALSLRRSMRRYSSAGCSTSLSQKGVEAPVLCTLSVVGQVRGALGGHSRYVKGTPRLSSPALNALPRGGAACRRPVRDTFAGVVLLAPRVCRPLARGRRAETSENQTRGVSQVDTFLLQCVFATCRRRHRPTSVRAGRADALRGARHAGVQHLQDGLTWGSRRAERR